MGGLKDHLHRLWRDESGAVQLTGTPPPAGVEYQVIEVTSKDNVMPLVPRKE